MASIKQIKIGSTTYDLEVVVDTALSTSSTRPVQNKTVTEAFDTYTLITTTKIDEICGNTNVTVVTADEGEF